MMNFLSRWRKQTKYQSLLWLESETVSGVEFSLRKMSLGSRIELSKRVRELTLRNEFLKAGELSETLEAQLADLFVEKLYVEWGIIEVRGLSIDGEPASVGLLIERGPEALVKEMAAAIRQRLELSEVERKNF